jgi:hypothetical protein
MPGRPFSDFEPRDRRVTPQIDISNLTEEPFSQQHLKRSRTVAFFEGPAALCLGQRNNHAGVILKLTADSGKEASGRHTDSGLHAADARGAGHGIARRSREQKPIHAGVRISLVSAAKRHVEA